MITGMKKEQWGEGKGKRKEEDWRGGVKGREEREGYQLPLNKNSTTGLSPGSHPARIPATCFCLGPTISLFQP
jgi:hypothetical protein